VAPGTDAVEPRALSGVQFNGPANPAAMRLRAGPERHGRCGALDVSHLDEETVGFSLRLRKARLQHLGHSLIESFLPELMPSDLLEGEEEEEEGDVGRPGSKSGRPSHHRLPSSMQAAQRRESVLGRKGKGGRDQEKCPNYLPDCVSREARWVQVEEQMAKRSAELDALVEQAGEARAAIELAKAARQVWEAGGEECEDMALEKAREIRQLKDELDKAREDINKLNRKVKTLKTEISKYEREIASQKTNSFYARLSPDQCLPVLQIQARDRSALALEAKRDGHSRMCLGKLREEFLAVEDLPETEDDNTSPPTSPCA